ncbi:hypothetical protein ACJZ2D_001663 [Fusarium nematophilum]
MNDTLELSASPPDDVSGSKGDVSEPGGDDVSKTEDEESEPEYDEDEPEDDESGPEDGVSDELEDGASEQDDVSELEDDVSEQPEDVSEDHFGSSTMSMKVSRAESLSARMMVSEKLVMAMKKPDPPSSRGSSMPTIDATT